MVGKWWCDCWTVAWELSCSVYKAVSLPRQWRWTPEVLTVPLVGPVVWDKARDIALARPYLPHSYQSIQTGAPEAMDIPLGISLCLFLEMAALECELYRTIFCWGLSPNIQHFPRQSWRLYHQQRLPSKQFIHIAVCAAVWRRSTNCYFSRLGNEWPKCINTYRDEPQSGTVHSGRTAV